MITQLHLDKTVVEQGALVIGEMNELCTSLLYAALLTDDGFEIVHVARDYEVVDGGRFSSMSSSIQALGEAVVHELDIGVGEYIIIASEGGYVIQLRVADHPMVLAALFSNEETLGKALSIIRLSAQRLSKLIDV